MKKYTRPTVEIVELESMQNMADVNPITATTVINENDVTTTVYNLAFMSDTSTTGLIG